ncbi:unnamed protein product [Mucor hiemalis]
MSENVMVTPLFHQRSHSMPVGHAFINNNNGNPNGVAVMDGNSGNSTNNRTFDYKRSSPLKNDLDANNPPLPTPKLLASQLHSNNKSPINAAVSLSKNEQQDNGNNTDHRFFCNPKSILSLYRLNRKTSSYPVIFNCKMDRGFFISQSHWTCYRRNYFQVTASFIIPGHSEGTPYALQLNSDKPMQPIRQFLLRLKACTSTSSASATNNTSSGEETILENHNMIRPVALTQMTPKRDKGPQREPPMIPILPSDSAYGCEQACVTFERLQFRVATANNGKRRASQQYFRLIFELIAELEEDGSQHVVSECYSSPLVVRGRSPGHYSSDSQYQQVQQQKNSNSSSECSEKSAPKKRKVASPTTPSPMHHHETVVSSSSSTNEKEISEVVNVTLPPPQYMYTSPPMIIEQQQHRSQEQQLPPQIPSSSSVTSSSSYHMIPVYNQHATANSAFSNYHHRSQSANDSDYYSRHRQAFKYHPNTSTNTVMEDGGSNNNNNMFEAYDGGMASALRNWQQQVIHQRTDSAATYDSFDGGNNRPSTRPGTPIPYNHHGSEVFNHQQQQGWSSPTAHSYTNSNESNEKLNSNRHSYQPQGATSELYNNNGSNN